MFSHSKRSYTIYPSGLCGNVQKICFDFVLIITIRGDLSLEINWDHHVNIKGFLFCFLEVFCNREKKCSCFLNLCKSGQCWRFLFALALATKWLWAFIVIFLYRIIVEMGWVLRGLLLSETLLKAIFHVHSSLHVRTSFLPFTVDVTGAISRAHHKLSSLCNCLDVEDWNKCLGLAGGLKH